MSLILGIALVCDYNGTIVKVLHNDLGIIEQDILQKPFPMIVAPPYFSKALSFLVELKSKQTLFDWELELLINSKMTFVYCTGLMLENDVLILVSQTHHAVYQLFEQVMAVNNEQTNLLRTLAKEKSNSSSKNDQEMAFYEEFSLLNNELINLQRDLAKKNAALEQLNCKIQHLVTIDDLTKVYNRRGFFELAQRELNQAKRYERPLSAIMIDIDFFKQVNDNYGHITGDIVLAEVAARCSQQLRNIDIFGRYGGEEFVALLPETELKNALLVAERLRYHVCESPICIESSSLTVTISLGVAIFKSDMTLENLFAHADLALYQAKESGRNQVYSFLDNSIPLSNT